MLNKKSRGKFIIIEGLDGSGKTTIAKELINCFNCFSYQKCFTFKSKFDNFVHAHKKTFLYYIYITIKTYFKIIPKLNRKINIIHDRYVQSINSFYPDNKYLYNKVFERIFNKILLKPNLYVYLYANSDEVVKRLLKVDNQTDHDDYHQSLINNLEKIKKRKSEYDIIFEKMKCLKIKINTTNKTIDECKNLIINEIKKIC